MLITETLTGMKIQVVISKDMSDQMKKEKMKIVLGTIFITFIFLLY